MLAITPGWNHTVPYPGRSPWRFLVVCPPLEKIASALSYFLIFFRRRLLESVHGGLVVQKDPGGVGVPPLMTQRMLVFNRTDCRHLTEQQAPIVGVIPPVLPDRQID